MSMAFPCVWGANKAWRKAAHFEGDEEGDAVATFFTGLALSPPSTLTVGMVSNGMGATDAIVASERQGQYR